MLVLPESKYDPTQTFSKYYPAPCDWASSHNRKGPSQYATWTYKEDATCSADQLLYAAKAQPEKAAQLTAFLAGLSQSFPCKTLSSQWRGMQGIEGKVSLKEVHFGRHVAIITSDWTRD